MKKKKVGIFIVIVVVLLFLITIPGWVNDIQKDKNNTESQSANSDGNNDKDNNVESKKKIFITDEDDFTLWNSLMKHYQKEDRIYRGFQLAECQWEGQRYYGLYNDEINVVFRDDDKAIEIASKGQQTSFFVYPTHYDAYDFEERGTTIRRFDMNLDDATEILIFAGDLKTKIQYVDVVDVYNQTVIPVNCTAEDLADNMPQIEVVEEKYSTDGKRESIVVKDSINGAENSYTLDMSELNVETIEFVIDTQNYDYVGCSNYGILTVESAIGIVQSDGSEIKQVAKITGDMVYQPQTQSLELDKETIYVEWYEKKDHIDNIIENHHGNGVMYDMNNDGVEEMIITERETGTGVHIQYLQVLDLVNRKEIPVEKCLQEVVALIPKFNVIEEKRTEDGTWESIIVEYQLNGVGYTQSVNMNGVVTDTTEIVVRSESEWYDVSEEGIMQIEVLLVFNSTISHYDIGAGRVICDMVYQPEKDAFVLAPDTMRIEWN